MYAWGDAVRHQRFHVALRWPPLARRWAPVSMHPMEFIIPALVAIGICILFTIPPAIYAARLRPADGLRAE